MKRPFESTDPLLRSLVEDVQEFPETAAALVRSQRKSRTILRGALTLAGLILAATIWLPQRNTTGSTNIHKPPALSQANHDDSPPATQGFVRVYRSTEEEPPEPLSNDATSREKELLRELQDVPVLIVKNQQGEIARVQILER